MDTLIANQWRCSLIERHLLAQIPAMPSAMEDTTAQPLVFEAYCPLVHSDGSLLPLRFVKEGVKCLLETCGQGVLAGSGMEVGLTPP